MKGIRIRHTHVCVICLHTHACVICFHAPPFLRDMQYTTWNVYVIIRHAKFSRSHMLSAIVNSYSRYMAAHFSDFHVALHVHFWLDLFICKYRRARARTRHPLAPYTISIHITYNIYITTTHTRTRTHTNTHTHTSATPRELVRAHAIHLLPPRAQLLQNDGYRRLVEVGYDIQVFACHD